MSQVLDEERFDKKRLISLGGEQSTEPLLVTPNDYSSCG
jgi:hypothetical protein